MTSAGPDEQVSGLVVVTGGSRGIGAATARRAAVDGWNVRITFRTGEDEAERVVADCRGLGSRADAVQVDVTEESDVVELFGSLPAAAGPLRGFVNNAGIVAAAASVVDLDAPRIRRLLEVNVLGAFLCAREAVRRMDDGGSIVNVSSRAAVLGSAGEYVDYAATKAALDALTTGLAQEVAGRGIRVNGVRPGFIDTGIHAPGRLERVAPSVPMGRAGRAEEVAAAICWLLSPESSFTTGAFLDVSGGR
jgi:NAD(P)-dependent dehydrogenase (short-subunit alcohol dehydrogenase family)